MERILSCWIFSITSFVIISGWSNAYEIEDLVVPVIADPRDNAILSCKYDMGKDRLYSAKWFKDEQELYRYMPAQKPPGMQFPVDGVHLSGEPKCSPTFCDLELTKLEARSAGSYRCEVSTEAPTFRFATRNATMTVAALPMRDPLVEGATTVYTLGEEIRVNCTSDPSLPAAEVTWYINEREATYPELEGASESAADSRGLSTKSLSLRLKAEKSLFVSKSVNGMMLSDPNGMLKLRCVSAMPVWVPGSPHKRQFTITAKLRAAPQHNQLGLLGSSGVTTRGCPGALLMATALMFLSGAFQRRLLPAAIPN